MLIAYAVYRPPTAGSAPPLAILPVVLEMCRIFFERPRSSSGRSTRERCAGPMVFVRRIASSASGSIVYAVS